MFFESPRDCSRLRGPWKGLEDVEFATLEWVAWYNVHRLLEPLGYVPPAEFEEACYGRQTAPAELAALTFELSGEPGAVHFYYAGLAPIALSASSADWSAPSTQPC